MKNDFEGSVCVVGYNALSGSVILCDEDWRLFSRLLITFFSVRVRSADYIVADKLIFHLINALPYEKRKGMEKPFFYRRPMTS